MERFRNYKELFDELCKATTKRKLVHVLDKYEITTPTDKTDTDAKQDLYVQFADSSRLHFQMTQISFYTTTANSINSYFTSNGIVFKKVNDGKQSRNRKATVDKSFEQFYVIISFLMRDLRNWKFNPFLLKGKERFYGVIEYLRILGLQFEPEEKDYANGKYWILTNGTSIHVRDNFFHIFATQEDKNKIEVGSGIKASSNNDSARPFGFEKLSTDEFLMAINCIVKGKDSVYVDLFKEKYGISNLSKLEEKDLRSTYVEDLINGSNMKAEDEQAFREKFSELEFNQLGQALVDIISASSGKIEEVVNKSILGRKNATYIANVYNKDLNLPIPKVEALDDTHSEEEIEEHAKSLTIDELDEVAHSRESNNVEEKQTTVKVRKRDAYISQYAKERANGICQLCKQPAPFCTKDGKPYLESHHIIWLSEGGADTVANTAALCPNCHKKMHILNNQEDIDILIKSNDESINSIKHDK